MAKGGRRGSCTNDLKFKFQRSASGVDISEVYSPPRVATIAAKRRGLSVGTSFEDESGILWDLSKKNVQERCMAKVKHGKNPDS